MPVRRPTPPRSPEEAHAPASLPPLNGRTDRQVIEQDGLTDEVLRWGGHTLGSLTKTFDLVDEARRRIRREFASRPASKWNQLLALGEDRIGELLRDDVKHHVV